MPCCAANRSRLNPRVAHQIGFDRLAPRRTNPRWLAICRPSSVAPIASEIGRTRGWHIAGRVAGRSPSRACSPRKPAAATAPRYRGGCSAPAAALTLFANGQRAERDTHREVRTPSRTAVSRLAVDDSTPSRPAAPPCGDPATAQVAPVFISRQTVSSHRRCIGVRSVIRAVNDDSIRARRTPGTRAMVISTAWRAPHRSPTERLDRRGLAAQGSASHAAAGASRSGWRRLCGSSGASAPRFSSRGIPPAPATGPGERFWPARFGLSRPLAGQ